VTALSTSNLPNRVAQALLGTQADAIVATDRHGVIRFWNPGAERIFGFGADNAVGQSLDIIIPENLRTRHWEGWARVIQTGQSRYGAGEVLSVPAMTADGRRISVEFTIVILQDNDSGVDGIAAILRDVTIRFEELRSLRRQLASRSPSADASIQEA
jgi:PAS domain S-box-containing protein